MAAVPAQFTTSSQLKAKPLIGVVDAAKSAPLSGASKANTQWCRWHFGVNTINCVTDTGQSTALNGRWHWRIHRSVVSTQLSAFFGTAGQHHPVGSFTPRVNCTESTPFNSVADTGKSNPTQRSQFDTAESSPFNGVVEVAKSTPHSGVNSTKRCGPPHHVASAIFNVVTDTAESARLSGHWVVYWHYGTSHTQKCGRPRAVLLQSPWKNKNVKTLSSVLGAINLTNWKAQTSREIF